MRRRLLVTMCALALSIGIVGYLIWPRNNADDFRPQGDLVYGNVRVTYLQILSVRSTPPQVNLAIKGIVPDSCFELYEANQRFVEGDYIIDLRAAKPSEATCQPMDKEVEKVLELDTHNLQPGTYTVSVGAQQVKFRWPVGS